MIHSLAADVLVALHAAYVGFVVIGQIAIVIGVLRDWGWVRNPWFRYAHLLAIGYVAFEAATGIDCPLTVWESRLRSQAGEHVADGTFLGRCLHNLIFYDLPAWALNSLHIGFAAIVLLTLILAPPRGWRLAKNTPR